MLGGDFLVEAQIIYLRLISICDASSCRSNGWFSVFPSSSNACD
jgi:hypothetical protein